MRTSDVFTGAGSEFLIFNKLLDPNNKTSTKNVSFVAIPTDLIHGLIEDSN
jgi:hypothetical protein